MKASNNQSTGNLHGISTSTPPLEEVNSFAPKFSATTTVKVKKAGNEHQNPTETKKSKDPLNLIVNRPSEKVHKPLREPNSEK